MTAGVTDIRVELSPEPEAAAVARDAMEELAGVVSEETLENVRLLVSELVTNAFRHGRLRPDQRIELRATLTGGMVRVEVRDPGGGFVRPIEPRPGEDSGWGLFLVDHIADRWGVDPERGTLVWLELSV